VSRPPVLWVDVTDLADYLIRHNRPSGIQRVAFEICSALNRQDDGAGQVGFVLREDGPRDLATVDWRELESAYAAITRASVPARAAAGPRPSGAAPGAGTGEILRSGLALQGKALLELARLPVAVASAVWRAARGVSKPRKIQTLHGRPAIRSDNFDSRPLAAIAAPGDSLVVLGSPWFHDDYVKTVRWARDELRLRFGLLIHDLIPVRHPEWCDRAVITRFAAWHRSVLPFVDQVFANSRFTANDVAAWAQADGIALSNPVRPVPIGTGLPPAASAADGNRLPTPGSYVLFVSTLEARKNHAQLFRVWRRLLGDLPPDRVPTLVFAGNVGWLVADLMQQLENARWLDGKIQLVSHPSDAELGALYRGCRFTVFPSLHEGWGLPVSESLALGQPCLASNTTSLPEAGGDLARYFDPENFDSAYQAVRAVLDDPVGLEAWRTRVRRDFHPVPWSESASIIRQAMDGLEVSGT
jgi:glycosyltransferase involved in cell wall biosynthesis